MHTKIQKIAKMEQLSLFEKQRNEFFEVVHQQHPLLKLKAIGLCKRYRTDVAIADDLLQEFYRKVLENHERVAMGYQKSGLKYLFKMLQNELLMTLRKEKSRFRIQENFGQIMPRIDQLQYFPLDHYLEEILRWMAVYITEKELQLMTLYMKGYNNEEISLETGTKAATVGVKIHRIKKLLKGKLNQK